MTNVNKAMKTEYFQIETLPSGVKILRLDMPGKVNVLKMAVLRELDGILSWLSNDPSLKGLILASGKEGVFVAGADINEISDLQKQPVENTYRVTMEAKEILAKLRALGVPSVAAINGACKGGGLELALWCTDRLAGDSLKVALAVPEVRLGLAPGFGGCVLLPRLIDTVKAITMIASGSDVGAQEAWEIGLVDELVPEAELIARAEAIALGGAAKRYAPVGHPPGKKTPIAEKLVAAVLDVTEPVRADRFSALRRLVGSTAHGFAASQVVAQIKKKARGYSAPARAAALALRTLTMPLDKALELESAEFSNMAQTRESANLVNIFLDRSRAKKLAGSAMPAAVTEIGVIGSGIMGREIAFEAIYADQFSRVVLVDIQDDLLARAQAAIAKLMAGRVKSGKLSQAEADAKMAKLVLSTSYDALVNCDAIIEVVPEKVEIKLATYAKLDQVMVGRSKPTPYFVFSNTSAKSLQELAKGVAYPANFSGMHFFNPVSQMAGVEIPGTTFTSPETMATAIAIVSAMGKVPLPCKDYPGFIVNAILGPYLVQTAHLLAQGVAPASIDKAILNFGMPMGPVELMDYVGLDVVASVASTLYAAHGERLALPSENLVARLVEKGFLGRKTDGGFYEWKEDKTVKDEKRRPVLNKVLAEIAPGLGKKVMAEEAIQELLIGTIEHEAMRVLEAGVVDEPFLLDLAFVISTGFTASLGGPLRHIDQRGVKTFADLGTDIAVGGDKPNQSWRKNFEPCALLAEHAKNRTNIYPVQ